MPPQPLGVDILQVFTTDIYHDLPSKTPALKGVAWKDLLVPFVGVVRDLKDLSGAKVVLLQDFARKVQLPLLQEGPYPTTGMMSWLEEKLSPTLREGVHLGTVVVLQAIPVGLLSSSPYHDKAKKRFKAHCTTLRHKTPSYHAALFPLLEQMAQNSTKQQGPFFVLGSAKAYWKDRAFVAIAKEKKTFISRPERTERCSNYHLKYPAMYTAGDFQRIERVVTRANAAVRARGVLTSVLQQPAALASRLFSFDQQQQEEQQQGQQAAQQQEQQQEEQQQQGQQLLGGNDEGTAGMAAAAAAAAAAGAAALGDEPERQNHHGKQRREAKRKRGLAAAAAADNDTQAAVAAEHGMLSSLRCSKRLRSSAAAAGAAAAAPSAEGAAAAAAAASATDTPEGQLAAAAAAAPPPAAAAEGSCRHPPQQLVGHREDVRACTDQGVAPHPAAAGAHAGTALAASTAGAAAAAAAAGERAADRCSPGQLSSAAAPLGSAADNDTAAAGGGGVGRQEGKKLPLTRQPGTGLTAAAAAEQQQGGAAAHTGVASAVKLDVGFYRRGRRARAALAIAPLTAAPAPAAAEAAIGAAATAAAGNGAVKRKGRLQRILQRNIRQGWAAVLRQQQQQQEAAKRQQAELRQQQQEAAAAADCRRLP